MVSVGLRSLSTLSPLGGRGRVLCLAMVLLLAPLPALALDEGDLTLTVEPDYSGGARPYAREMVLLRLRGTYRTILLLEELRQPPLTNFSWTQLGRDKWGRVQMPDGQMSLTFERTIAVFPQHTGTFEIEPFTHRLTINDGGERRLVEVRSKPVTVAVDTWKEAGGGPDAPEPWWLPARDVSIADSWEPDPETVKIGETTRRTVTLEAHGMLAEGLPPRPILRTRGILTFVGPVKRETLITPSGPVARATYQWDIKPAIREVIPLDAIKIPWFDTLSRRMREAEIPARQIGGGLAEREDDLKPPPPASWPMIALSALAAFGLGLLLIGLGTGAGQLRLGRAGRRALSRAAAAGDAVAFRAALARAMQADPELAAAWREDPGTVAGLAALDRQVYGAEAAARPDLPALARLFGRSYRRRTSVLAEAPRLAPLDGPAPGR